MVLKFGKITKSIDKGDRMYIYAKLEGGRTTIDFSIL